MSIESIKRQIDIIELAGRLGIEVNKYQKALCPFHEDKRPSLQFSREKQIATCFSGHCKAGTMDVIGLVEKRKNLSTKEALEWLKEEYKLIEERTPSKPNYGQLFRILEGNLKKSSRGKKYLSDRGLLGVEEKESIGYNVETMGEMRYSLIFPLRDKKGGVVSYYGRSIQEKSKSKHYYSKDRRGLYPGYPKANTKTLILTESVIDALSIVKHYEKEGTELLALYGSNGFTIEHKAAIQALKDLQEIILMLDGDAAGRAGTDRIAREIKELLPDLATSYVALPEGEDANSIIISHPEEEKELIKHLLKNRKSILLSKANEKEKQPSIQSAEAKEEEGYPSPELNTSNPELLTYRHGILQFTVLGGIKITGLDRLRVTLKIEHREQRHYLPIRHNLDLYHSSQVEQLSQKLSEQLDRSSQETIGALASLTSELENYRAARLEALKPKIKAQKTINIQEKAEALELLQSPHLMEKTQKLLKESGIIGEETNSMIGYLIYTSRKQKRPLHVIYLGSSGSGKTHLQEKLGSMIPEEEKLEITSLSENAFYYFGREELKHKLILIEDLDGAESVLYPLRELQSKGKISKTVTLKDSKGNLKTVTLQVEGPVSVSGCTTRERIYEDNSNRSILLYTDTSKEQDQKILAYQQRQYGGTIDKTKERACQRQLENLQRLLSPIEIRNPYAELLELPASIFKPRRTMQLLLSFIETITYYHQYQREKKGTVEKPYIESNLSDIQWGLRLLEEVLFNKSDELSGASRKFLEKLKKETEVLRGDLLRKKYRIAPSTLKRYLLELTRYGYLKISGGSRYRGYEYAITDREEGQQLREEINRTIEETIKKVANKSK